MRLYPPAGSIINVLSVAGDQYTAAGDHSIDLPARYLIPFLAQGWTIASDEILVAASADFAGLVGVVPGLCVFHSGLNKPLWRNAANSGWVDATSGAVVP